MAPLIFGGAAQPVRAVRSSKSSTRLSSEPLSALRANAAVFSLQAAHCGMECLPANAAARVRSAHGEAAHAERQQRLKDFQRQCQRRVSQRLSGQRSGAHAVSQAKAMSPPRAAVEHVDTLKEISATTTSHKSREPLLQPSDHAVVPLHHPVVADADADVCSNRLISLIAGATESRCKAMCRLGLRPCASPADVVPAAATDESGQEQPLSPEESAADLQSRKQSVLGQMLKGKHATLLSSPKEHTVEIGRSEAVVTAETGIDALKMIEEREAATPHEAEAEAMPVEEAWLEEEKGREEARQLEEERRRVEEEREATPLVEAEQAEGRRQLEEGRRREEEERQARAVPSSSSTSISISPRSAREDTTQLKTKIGKASTSSAALAQALSPGVEAASSSTRSSKAASARSSTASASASRSATLAKDVSTARSSSSPGSLSNGGERAMRYTSGLLSLLLRAYAKQSRPPPALCACVPQPTEQPPPQIQSDGHLSQAPVWEAYVQRIACPSSHARNCEFSHNLSRLQRQVLILIQEANDPSRALQMNLASSSSSLSRTPVSPSCSMDSFSSISKSQCSVPVDAIGAESPPQLSGPAKAQGIVQQAVKGIGKLPEATEGSTAEGWHDTADFRINE